MCDMIIFIPVGSSIVTNKGEKPKGKPDERPSYETVKILVDHLIKGYKKSPIRNVFFERGYKDDLNPAEISSLYGFCLEGNIQKEKIKVVLFHSPEEGRAYAEGVECLIKSKAYFASPEDRCWSPNWQIEPVEIAGLDPKNPETFSQAMNLISQKIIEKIVGFDGSVYLNITGGYKAIEPYLTIIGMTLGQRVTIFYLHEKSPSIIKLPTYPLAFDLLEWRDKRSLLSPFMEGMGLDESQKKLLYEALRGTRLEGLISPEDYTWTSIGEVMEGLYSRQKGKGITEFGEGGVLLDLLRNKGLEGEKLAGYLSEKCIPRWRHLSAGDHIPETVEHGRGHIQRLLELAQQLIIAADLNLTTEQIFVLIASIWLHDIGHSSNYFEFEEGLIDPPDPGGIFSKCPVIIHGNPDDVRKYHNFLSYQLIKDHKNFLFPAIGAILDMSVENLLLRSVAMCCLYHRRAMPKNGEKKDDRAIIKKGIVEFKGGAEVIQGFPLVAALLRFLDGAENQEERTGSLEYYEVMKWVINRQTDILKALPEYNDSGSRLRREVDFKEEQRKHYLKHRMVQNVFIVREREDGLRKEGTYGSSGKETLPLIGIYFILSKEVSGDYLEVRKKIVHDMLDEFKKVEDLLPFRLVLILIDSQKKEKMQVLIKPSEQLKELKDWESELFYIIDGR